MKPETKYVILLTSLYFIASLVGVLHHELWLDESHHWLISRDSTSLANLIENTRYEGHPIFWNIILYVITRWTLNPLWMQLLHILISTLVINFFVRKAPFPLVFKALFIFGYFMFFEYNIISRNYALGILFLFVACALFKRRKTHFIQFSFFLVLAANMHLMFAIIAFAMMITILFENYCTSDIRKPSFLVGWLIFLAGIFFLTMQVIPTGENDFFIRVHEIPFSEKFTKGFISLFRGIITIPDFRSIHFWNSNLFVNVSKPVTAILGLIIYALPLLLFRKKATLLFVYLGLIGTQVFFFVLQLAATRYDGMTFLIIIVALWIDSELPKSEFKWVNFLQPSGFELRKPIMLGVLSLHFFSGICAYAFDIRYPFTTAKETVEYLKSEKLDGANVVTVTCDGTLFSSYLGKKVWFLCDGREQSFCRWYQFCSTPVEREMIVESLSEYMNNHKYAVYVSYYPITQYQSHEWIDVNHKFKIRFRKRTGESIIRNNSLYIYEIAKL